MSSIDQQFIEYVVKSLVSNPDAVVVERRIDEKGVLLELTVDPEDLGRVIGKRGATAQSLRTLLRALGTKNDARYNLKIVDNGVGGHASSNEDDDVDVDQTDVDNDPDEDLKTGASADETVAEADRANEDFKADADLDDDDASFGGKRDDSTRLSKTRRELQELDDLDV